MMPPADALLAFVVSVPLGVAGLTAVAAFGGGAALRALAENSA